MAYFRAWEDYQTKSADDKKKFFNSELKKIFDENLSRNAIEKIRKVISEKDTDFRVDLNLKGKDDQKYLDILICNDTGKVMYWALYDYNLQKLSPQQDVLYIDYIFCNMPEIIPLLEKVISIVKSLD